MSPLEKLEQFFKMPLKQIISEIHWKEQKSLKSISDQSSVSRQTITNLCNKQGIKLRSLIESTQLTKNRGKNHWSFGLTKEDSPIMLAHSERMKKKNPSLNIKTRTKTAIARAEYFKKNPWPQEEIFRDILFELSVDSIFQYPIGQFVIDFFIPNINLCIEIDSTDKWGKEKRLAAFSKDKILEKKGYKILRINKNKLDDWDFIIDILKCNNVIT